MCDSKTVNELSWYQHYARHYPWFSEKAHKLEQEIAQSEDRYEYVAVIKITDESREVVERAVHDKLTTDRYLTAKEVIGHHEFSWSFKHLIFIRLTDVEASFLAVAIAPSEAKIVCDKNRAIWTALLIAQLATNNNLTWGGYGSRKAMVASLWEDSKLA